MIRRKKRTEKKTNPRVRQREFPRKTDRISYECLRRESCLAGEFNGWDPYSLPMKKGKDGIWKATTRLPPGRYE